MRISTKTGYPTSRRRSLSALALSLLIPLGTLNWAAPAAFAKKHHDSAGQRDSLIGVDAVTLDLMNHGDWKGAAARLEPQVSQNSSVSRPAAWLAFAYMYLNKCDELHSLSEKARQQFDARDAANLPADQGKTPAPADETKKAGDAAANEKTSEAIKPVPKRAAQTDAEVYGAIVQAYDSICRTRYGDAACELSLIPPARQTDPLVDFALAADALKEGKTDDAVTYTEKTVAAAPEFGWGYRTLGRLYQNRLKDYARAEQAYQSAINIAPDFDEVIGWLVDLRLSKNNFDGAIDAANAAILARPKDPSNYYRLAQIYIQQWRLREALSELNQAIALDPSNAKYFRSRASIKRYQGSFNDAVADQQKAVDLAKDKPFELVELSAMNVAAGNLNRAADNLQEALKVDPDNQDAHVKLVGLLTQEKRWDDLAAEFQRLVDRKPKDAALRIGYAHAFLNAGKADKAIEEYKEAANLDPNNPEPHRQIGAIKLTEKDFEGAVREYTRALNINPSSVPDLISLGYAYAQNDDETKAEAAFVTALALQRLTQPDTPQTAPARLELMRSLAAVWLDEGRFSEATTQYELITVMSKGTAFGAIDQFMLDEAKLLRDLSNASAKTLLDAFNQLPADVQNQQRLGMIDSLLTAHKTDLALPMIDEQLAKADLPEGVKKRLALQKARALVEKARYADAEAVVAPLVANSNEKGKEVSQALVCQAQALAGKGALSEAEKTAKKAADAYQSNFNAYIELGRIYLKEGKRKEAAECAKNAMNINPYATRAYLLLGDTESAGGEIKEASQNYRRAAEMYPGLLEAHRSLLETLRKLSRPDEVKREEEQIAQMEKQQ